MTTSILEALTSIRGLPLAKGYVEKYMIGQTYLSRR
jgi:hypothetical protein